MAISWGSWEYGNSSAGFRVGVEVTSSAVTSSSTSWTCTTKWYVEAMYNVDDEMTVTFGGSISGSSTQNLTTGSSGGYKLWATKTYTYTYSTYGSSPGTRTFSGSLSGVYNGATPTKSVTVTIPARPNNNPAAPSSVTSVYTSDTSVTVSWVRNATSTAPYSSVTVQRRKWVDAGGWSSWLTVATTSSTATSFLDTAADPNTVREYQVRANNASGSSGWVTAASAVKLRPDAPTAATATLQPSGTAIVIAWTNNHYTGQGNKIKIQRSVAGGAYADLSGATALAETTTSFTDAAPGAGTNAYRVFAYTNGSPVLTSTEGQTNTVSTTAPPLAPTLLSPNGVAVDFATANVLSWQHNPGGDGAAQSSFILQTSIDGGTNWVTKATVTSTVSSWTMPAGTHTNGQSVLWRVQTRGVVAAGYGPNSASATLTGSATPVTAVTGPATPVTALPATATWTYTQAQSSPQNAWELELLNGAVVVETASGTTGTSRALTSSLLQQGASYTIRVRTRSTAGIWSAWATRAITINLAPPAHVTVAAEYQHPTGTVVLSLAAATTQAGEVAVTSATVARRVPGGEWVTLVKDVALPNDVLDLLPATNGTNEYRVTAKSNTPTYRDEAIVEVTPPNPLTADDRQDRQWIFVNYGSAFTNVLRFRSTPKVSVTTGRDKAAQQFLGRKKPVPSFGEARSRVISVTGQLVHDEQGGRDDVYLWDSPPPDWEEAGLESETICYRDFTGRRVFGILSDVSATDEMPGLANVSFAVTETDYTEAYA